MENEPNIKELEQLLERRNHELKSIKLLVKQKTEETKKYYEICGENPTYTQLSNILSAKLTESETKVKDARARVNELKEQHKKLTETQKLTNEINENISDSTKKIQELKDAITAKTADIEKLEQAYNKKTEQYQEKQSIVDSLKKKLEDSQSRRDTAAKEYNLLLEQEKSLHSQQSNLNSAIESTRASIDSVKKLINLNIIKELQNEVDQYQQQLGDSSVDIFEDITISDIDDLDDVYKKEISTAADKILQLKESIKTLNFAKDQAEQEHRLKMTELRVKLDRLKKENDMTRLNIEEIELSFPQALGPLSREIEQWRAKVDSIATRSRDEEKKLRAEREKAESELAAEDEKRRTLQDDLLRAKAAVAAQKAANEAKLAENSALEKDVEKLREENERSANEQQALQEDLAKITAENEELRKSVEEAEEKLKKITAQTATEMRELSEKVTEAESKAGKMSPATDLGGAFMNERELVESVRALEKDLALRESEMVVVRQKYDEAEAMRQKFEAALALISELQEEEELMKGELKMIRQRFNETLRQVKASKNAI